MNDKKYTVILGNFEFLPNCVNVKQVNSVNKINESAIKIFCKDNNDYHFLILEKEERIINGLVLKNYYV